MIIKLLKANKKTTDIIILEQENNLTRKKERKLGKPVSFSSTSNCGSKENADSEISRLVQEYKDRGFVVSDDTPHIEAEVFDKAKWHLEGDYPEELGPYQAYDILAFM